MLVYAQDAFTGIGSIESMVLDAKAIIRRKKNTCVWLTHQAVQTSGTTAGKVLFSNAALA
jgi:hypothetical protein